MALPRPDWLRATTSQKLTLLCLLLGIAALVCQYLFSVANLWLSLAIVTNVIVLRLLLQYVIHPLLQEIAAINLQAQNLQDGSFNSSANQLLLHELKPLANNLNKMSEQLRQERASLYQRELLLDTVLQSSPAAIILTSANDTVLMSNPAARHLLNQGKKFDGNKLKHLTINSPVLSQALQHRQQGLLRLDTPQGQTVWHLAVSQFQLNQQQHWLYLLKPLTRELQREELNAWKKLLRVIGHELNNTLAPLSSLAFSGSQLAEQQQDAELSRLFATISERCLHLNQFVQAYIEFAKLPAPSFSTINWPRLINQLQDQYEFELTGKLPQRSWQADPVQLAQLLLNLLKNAHESGSPVEHITLELQEQPQELLIRLRDAGGGLTDTNMQHAVVPFYSTKPQGSGIGLTLCRDIIEAHGGSLALQNIGSGLEVLLTLPVKTDITPNTPDKLPESQQ